MYVVRSPDIHEYRLPLRITAIILDDSRCRKRVQSTYPRIRRQINVNLPTDVNIQYMCNSQLNQRLQHLLCASTITVLSLLNDSAKFIPLINFGFSITSQVKETKL